jgi:glycosyltransferase involved in cell wall biosynthesis
MKILFNTYPTAFNTPGGGEQQLLDYKKYLEDKKIDIKFFNQWKKLPIDCDILHFFSVMPGSLITLDYIKKNLDIPVVISPNFWVDLDGWKNSGVYDEIKTILWLVDKIIVNSTIEKEMLFETMKDVIYNHNIVVVHNMYNNIFLERVTEKLFREAYDIQDKYILNVANIEPRKNQLDFLKALKDFPEYKLITIGSIRDKSYYDACKEIAKEQFIHLERIENNDPLLRSAYSGCEFFAMPSLIETPSISALEAAVSGSKILITELGSTREYFSDFVEYVNPYDIDIMRNQIKRTIEKDNNKLLSEHILLNYSSKIVMEELLSVYSSVITKKG